MHNDTLRSHPLTNPDYFFLREDHYNQLKDLDQYTNDKRVKRGVRTAGKGVFEGDEFGRSRMNVFTEHGVIEYFLESQVMAVLGRDCVRTSLGVHSYSSGFVEVDVGSSVENDRVGRLDEVSTDGELIGLS